MKERLNKKESLSQKENKILLLHVMNVQSELDELRLENEKLKAELSRVTEKENKNREEQYRADKRQQDFKQQVHHYMYAQLMINCQLKPYII